MKIYLVAWVNPGVVRDSSADDAIDNLRQPQVPYLSFEAASMGVLKEINEYRIDYNADPELLPEDHLDTLDQIDWEEYTDFSRHRADIKRAWRFADPELGDDEYYLYEVEVGKK